MPLDLEDAVIVVVPIPFMSMFPLEKIYAISGEDEEYVTFSLFGLDNAGNSGELPYLASNFSTDHDRAGFFSLMS